MAKYQVTYYDKSANTEKTEEIEAWTVKREGEWTNFVESNGQLVWSRRSNDIRSIDRIEADPDFVGIA